MSAQHDGQTACAEKVDARRRWHLPLEVYDFLLLLIVDILLLFFSPSSTEKFGLIPLLAHFLLSAVCVYLCRRIGGVYKQIWRYGSPTSYIRLIAADFAAGILYYGMQVLILPTKISFIRVASVITVSLLAAMAIRMLYQYVYEVANKRVRHKGLFWRLVTAVTGFPFESSAEADAEHVHTKIRVAIVGAGQVGAMLAEEFLKNPRAAYTPCCFIDIDRSKIGREILGIPVLASGSSVTDKLQDLAVQEIVFALPRMEPERLRELYDFYAKTGCKIKVYDFPIMQTAENGKRRMREFDIEELLFRKPIHFEDDKIRVNYKDKVVLITGGGGSIGSELARQIAAMQPKTLILLDIYENGAYDLQQELRIVYGDSLHVCVEIASICDRDSIEKVMQTYRPQIVLHAAAHKHVPLMEHNCCEAVRNNVFGTLNVVELAEKYEAERFVMLSTDKAVNPTNVMGATKRVCEMIVQSHCGSSSKTKFSATRFGNVLGSAASVVPLFKKQIMNGGPVTITDKRIIRYFMTIPEACQLVLKSGTMAKNGELFVLDMGKSIRILELAESMIRLSGYEPYRDIDIVETGLRPGEKLYEELLIRTEELDKTEDSMIFIERDEALSADAIAVKLQLLRGALETGDDEAVRETLMRVVPTYHDPDRVNESAIEANTLDRLSAEPEQVLAL